MKIRTWWLGGRKIRTERAWRMEGLEEDNVIRKIKNIF
jgi:hypothetical protein